MLLLQHFIAFVKIEIFALTIENGVNMEYDKDKVEEIVLALLQLTSFSEKDGTFVYHGTWKSYPWEVMDSLYEKGYISNPKSKAKSVTFYEDGYIKSKELFQKYFVK